MHLHETDPDFQYYTFRRHRAARIFNHNFVLQLKNSRAELREVARREKAQFAAKQDELKCKQDALLVVKTELEKITTENFSTRAALDESLGEADKLEKKIYELSEANRLSENKLEEHQKLVPEAKPSEQPSEQAAIETPEQLRQNIDAIETEKARISAELKEVQKRLEGMPRPKPIEAKVSGKVLAINPGWNFLIVSLGKKSGLRSDGELMIYRSGKLIGRARVSRIEQASSVCDIERQSLTSGMQVQPADTVSPVLRSNGSSFQIGNRISEPCIPPISSALKRVVMPAWCEYEHGSQTVRADFFLNVAHPFSPTFHAQYRTRSRRNAPDSPGGQTCAWPV